MAAIHIADIEAAVHFWRGSKASPDGVTAALDALARAEICAPPIVRAAGQPLRRAEP
ncbi:MAG: DUF3717 domain-containing protein [Ramlibacter sp.]|nr:DUF3717 domain-containing protein [Ramlibacter sp.]